MKISLGESDAFLHSDGRAHMIIIHVTLDSGKQVQFPYEADKPISELYESVKNITDEKIVVPLATVPLVSVATPAAEVSLSSSVAVPSVEDNQIGREDLVRCIKVEPRAKDAPIDIVVGNIYRVLKVHGPRLTIDGKVKQIIDGFDVIDDKSETPRRIFAAPSEMEFYQKRKPAPVKVIGKFESTFLCPHCFILMVAVKEDDGKYHGKCMSCLKESTHELKAKEDAKPTVGNSPENEQARTGTAVPASV
jgi:hypothetical protein